MITKFREYYPPSDDTFRQLWDSALFVLDANVLLSIYRYSEETANQILLILRKLDKRVWIPYQSAKEFQQNRLNVISSEKDSYSDFQKKLASIEDALNNRNRNPFLRNDIFNKLKESLSEATMDLKSKESLYSDLLKNDTILIEISKVLDGKVGEEFSKSRMMDIYKEGKERFKAEIPPGYKDVKKGGNQQYGDLVMWFQIIEKAKTEQMNVIFITNDEKEDWWKIHKKQNYGPRAELRKEFFENTGKECFFYRPYKFLERAKEYDIARVGQEAINEAKALKISECINANVSTSSIISIDIIVEVEADSLGINHYLNSVRSRGYQISNEVVAEKIHKFIVQIPDIPDLVRRFREFSLPLLKECGLNLVDFKTKTLYFV